MVIAFISTAVTMIMYYESTGTEKAPSRLKWFLISFAVTAIGIIGSALTVMN
jgi:hypothetical protein